MTPLHWGTISPPLALSPLKRIQYTAGMLRVLCRVYGINQAAIEDYAHKLRSSSVTPIREQGGAIKQMLIDEDIELFVYNISVIKKFATGFGGASKADMAATFISMSHTERNKLFNRMTRRRQVLTEHEIDAWFIGRLHYDNVRRKLMGEVEWVVECSN